MNDRGTVVADKESITFLQRARAFPFPPSDLYRRDRS